MSDKFSTASPVGAEDMSNLTKNFKDLHINGLLTDVILNVKGREFRTHKAVLAASSPVFCSMFQHDMIEKACGTVDIPDCDPDTFESFLNFLYTGKLDKLSFCEASNLFKTADKYILKELKTECVQYIHRELSEDNFFDVVNLAFMHIDTDLINLATVFFVKNMKSILRKTEWLIFVKENPSLATELFIKVNIFYMCRDKVLAKCVQDLQDNFNKCISNVDELTKMIEEFYS